MPKPRGGQRPNYNSGTSGGGGRFAALNDYQNGGKDDEMKKNLTSLCIAKLRVKIC